MQIVHSISCKWWAYRCWGQLIAPQKIHIILLSEISFHFYHFLNLQMCYFIAKRCTSFLHLYFNPQLKFKIGKNGKKYSDFWPGTWELLKSDITFERYKTRRSASFWHIIAVLLTQRQLRFNCWKCFVHLFCGPSFTKEQLYTIAHTRPEESLFLLLNKFTRKLSTLLDALNLSSYNSRFLHLYTILITCYK